MLCLPVRWAGPANLLGTHSALSSRTQPLPVPMAVKDLLLGFAAYAREEF